MLIVLLAEDATSRAGGGVRRPRDGRGADPGGYLGPFLAASLMASFVMYGFDTAGSLAEETDEPRRLRPCDPRGAGVRRPGRRAC